MNTNLIKDEKGAALVLVALMLTVLLGSAALAIDVGRIYVKRASLQSAVDAASLAAVHSLPDSTSAAGTVADLYMDKNGFELVQLTSYNKEYLNSNKKIRITASIPLEYIFGKIFKSGTTVTRIAAAEVITPIDDLDYAIFSGSTLEWLLFTGNSTVVEGDVHSNEDIKGTAKIDGSVSAVGNIITPLNVTGTQESQSPFIEMPKLSDAELAELKSSAIANGTYFSGNQSFSADDLNNLFTVTNDTVIYVDGNVNTNGTGVEINTNTYSGTIVATGDITFDGSHVTLTQNSPICFYSLHGDITLNGSGATLYGAVWALEGEAAFNGTGSTLIGKLYGYTVKMAGGIKVQYKTDDFPEFIIKKYRLVE